MSRRVKHPQVLCVQCNHLTPDFEFARFTCCVCQTGPLCEGCIGNDIDHDRDDYPLCVSCVKKCHWYDCCEMIAAFPGEIVPPRCKDCGVLTSN